MGFLLKVVSSRSSGNRMPRLQSHYKKVHIYRHEYSTLVHHCVSCSVGAYPSCVGAKKQRDAPQKLPVYCTATLEDKQRFTPPDNGSCLVCGRNTCGEPTQIHREQIDLTQRGPGTGNRIHSIFAVSQCQRWEDFLKVTRCNCKLPVENVISSLLSQSKSTGSDDASLLLDPFKAQARRVEKMCHLSVQCIFGVTQEQQARYNDFLTADRKF